MIAMTKHSKTPLIDRLPSVRGRLTAEAPLAGITWFRVGGTAEVMFRPANRDDLIEFLRQKPRDLPVTVIGVASNLLVRDGGVPGVVLRLGRGFAEIRAEGEEVFAGAGALDFNIATAARIAGTGGLEFLCGVPGTLGGALRMNAGAYGRELKDVLIEAEAVDGYGNLHRLAPEDFGFRYRGSAIPEDWIFLSARLRGEADDPKVIARRMTEIQTARAESQPVRTRTGGSTFKNPEGAKAWELIDNAGCRGLKRGGAMVSEKHCNFLINTGNATAADIEALGEEVRRRVRDDSGIELQWEIRRIGIAGDGDRGEAA
ncbi:MAG: UDP-N-acetylmuramate dehydrogenase [Kiloniellales bacterium]|nr:UDP-N-acetylmuramate dehydrogenase [Kiloniellales bacterium]